jgi:hypothetical protein
MNLNYKSKPMNLNFGAKLLRQTMEQNYEFKLFY